MDERGAISNLVYAYADRIDAGDFEGVADLLRDAVVSAEGNDAVYRGYDAILGMYTAATRRYEDGTPRTKHVTTNLAVELDEGGRKATARSYFTVLQAVPGQLALQPVIAGRYRDGFELGGTGWRFTSRHMIVDLVGDLSHHLLYELPEETGRT
ncbi:MAG TPA: nuclear transport factor 2 family protein [Acidimicrobiales bacterium]|nr:nuclear transport factor 2 family protein [Acidimicrobiales bacterium]